MPHLVPATMAQSCCGQHHGRITIGKRRATGLPRMTTTGRAWVSAPGPTTAGGSPIVHLGLHKTGSTFLQERVWPAFFGDRWAWPRAADVLTDIGSFRSYALVSQENLSGVLLPSYPGESWRRFERFVDAARSLNPRPRLIMIIRPHLEWLWSAYLDRAKRGYRGTFSDYLERFSEADLSWAERTVVLQREFNDVLIMHHGDLKTRPAVALSRIAKFAGLEITDEALSTLVAGSANVNESPRTAFAMAVARFAYNRRTLRTIKRVSRRLRSGGEDVQPFRPSTIAGKMVKYANLAGVGKPMEKPRRLPPPWEERCNEDWLRAANLLGESRRSAVTDSDRV